MLARAVRASGGGDIVSDADAVPVAVSAYSALEAGGWERQYNAGLDMSFPVPTVALAEGGPSDTFVNLKVRGSSIGYSLAVSDGKDGTLYHRITAGLAVGDVHAARRPLLWITSARTGAARPSGPGS